MTKRLQPLDAFRAAHPRRRGESDEEWDLRLHTAASHADRADEHSASERALHARVMASRESHRAAHDAALGSDAERQRQADEEAATKALRPGEELYYDPADFPDGVLSPEQIVARGIRRRVRKKPP